MRKKRPLTLILGLAAGLALVVGVIAIFDLPAGSVWAVLLPLFVLLLSVILLGLVAATVMVLVRRYFDRRR